MAKKKDESATNATLLKLRGQMQELSDAIDKRDKPATASALVRTTATAIELNTEFGEGIDKLVIPDGFFDAFDNKSRHALVVGFIMGCQHVAADMLGLTA